MSAPDPKRTIAAMFSTFTAPSHKAMFLGAADCAKKLGYNLLTYAGGTLRAEHEFNTSRNNIFRCLSRRVASGIVIAASSIARMIPKEEFKQFLDRYQGMPMVSVGSRMGDQYGSVVPDYDSGMHAICEHMLDVHSMTKLVLVRGPENNASSNQRHNAFAEYLKSRGVKLAPESVIFEELNDEAGVRVARAVVDKGRELPQAFFTVNDGVAMGMISEFQRQGVKIPADVAVVGYQGRFEGRFFNPALTTVDEDSYQQGYGAAEHLIQHLEGQCPLGSRVTPTRLQVRASCGCKYAASDERIDVVEEMLDQREQTLNRARSFISNFASNHHSLDEDSVRESLTGYFEEEYDNILVQNKRNQDIYIDLYWRVGFSLNSVSNMNRPIEIMAQIYGLRFGYMALFDKNFNDNALCHLEHVYRGGQHLTVSDESQHFHAEKLLPPEYFPEEEPYSLVIMPLRFRDTSLGFLAFDLCTREGLVYESLAVLVGFALFSEQQYLEAKMAQERFSDIAFSTSDWLWEVDSEFCFTYSSEEAIKVIGYSNEEIIGRSLFSFLLPGEKDTEEVIRHHYAANSKQIVNLECWSSHKNSNVVVFLISGTPIIGKKGELKGYRGAFKDVTEKKRTEEKITFMAYYDQLTGLANRTMFMEHLKTGIAECDRNGSNLAVFFMDLDRFKNINDTLGHDFGDELLRQVAGRIKALIRKGDTFARQGGDEFVLLTPRLQGTQVAANIAAKILAAMQQPFNIFHETIHVTSSVGIALYPFDADSAESLLKKADIAMYKAKDEGKNRFFFYYDEMDQKSKYRMELEQRMYKAIEAGQFVPFFQPITNAADGSVWAMETLARWLDPERGMIGPAEFISIAEDNGSIERIGQQIFEKSALCLKEHQRYGNLDLKCSVNISARQLQDLNLATSLMDYLLAHEMSPAQFELEITESAVMKNEKKSIYLLEQLREAGFALSLDDFGTGFSSLSFLQRLPISTVKIDRSYVVGIGRDRRSETIVRAIIEMCRSMELTVIAEGIETAEQAGRLLEWGCDLHQGYFYAKPMPHADMLAHLQSRPVRSE